MCMCEYKWSICNHVHYLHIVYVIIFLMLIFQDLAFESFVGISGMICGSMASGQERVGEFQSVLIHGA